MAGGIIALDIASNVGWASASAEAVAAWPATASLVRDSGPLEHLHYGSHRVASIGLSDGAHFSGFQHWLTAMVRLEKPEVIVYEAPFPVRAMARGRTSQQVATRLMGLAAIADTVAYDERLRIYMIDAQSVRKHFAGTGRADKARVMDVCRFRGWEPRDHDASDALAVMDYAVSTLYPPGQGRKTG